MGFTDVWRNFQEYAEQNGIERSCEFCGLPFTPRSPNQKYHSRSDHDYELEDAACEDARWFAKMPRDTWIRKVVGISPQEFIATYGQEEYDVI